MVSSERVAPAQETMLRNKASLPMKLAENDEVEMGNTQARQLAC
jgi:hypothetical protein